MRAWGFGAILVVVSLSFAPPAEAAAPACGATITHSITLSADVGTYAVPCPDDGLIVSRSGITIDLGNREVFGDGSGDGIHLLTNVKDVVVRRGTVRGFANGIHSDGNNRRTSMSRLISVANFRGMVVIGDNISVSRSIVADNSDIGIALTGVHPAVRSSDVVRNSTGISLGGGAGAVVSKNRVASNSNHGIELVSGGVARGNVVTGSAGHGIHFLARSRVIGNSLLGNAGDGINGSGDGSVLRRNLVLGNSYGIDVDASNAKFDRNTTNGNEADGIFAFGGSNVISNNHSDGNRQYGIELNGPGLRVFRNVVRGNSSDGIHWFLGDGVAERNVLIGNGYGTGGVNGIQEGIDTTGATVTGSRNLVFANDHRDCVPASLCTSPGTTIANVQTLGCGAHVTESVKLQADVGSDAVGCSGDGLIVDNPDVTIDLDGHTIWGDGSVPPAGTIRAGVQVGTKENVHVLNGSIRQFQVGLFKGVVGIVNGEGRGPILEGLLIGECKQGVLVDGNHELARFNAFVANTPFDGIDMEGSGTITNNVGVGNGRSYHSNFTVENNVARFDTGQGISSVGGIVRRNVVIHSTDDGIHAPDSLVDGNQVIGSGYPASGPPVVSDGIDTDIIGETVTRNVSIRNHGAGINASVKNVSISRNVVALNDAAGIVGVKSGSLTRGNLVMANATDGLQIGGDDARVFNNAFVGNRGGGLTDSNHPVTIKRNAFLANGANGVVLLGAGVIDANVANGNGHDVADGVGYGIDAAAGSGNNRGFGNDNPAQCNAPARC